MCAMNRRDFIKAAGTAGAAAGAAALLPGGRALAAEKSPPYAYPQQTVGKAKDFRPAKTVHFTYPDASSPCLLLRTGRPVPGGVGPQRDIVAFSILCTHQGCPTSYDPVARTFKCPCHYSIFDPEKGGEQVCGQGTTKLPQIELEYDSASDTVRATGVLGLLYGRTANFD